MSPRDFGHQGIWSRRIYNSHPDMAVDCWVRTDTLDADLALCLQRFQEQGGELNPEATAYLEEFLSMDGETASRDKRVHPSTYERPCEYFFPLGSAERAAINEVDEPACSLVAGGCDCCTPLPYPPIADGTKWPNPYQGEPFECINKILHKCFDAPDVRERIVAARAAQAEAGKS